MELSYNELFFGKIEDDVYKGELFPKSVNAIGDKQFEEIKW